MKHGTIVRHGDRLGIVVEDLWACCALNEVPVIFENSDRFVGIPIADLVEIGPEEPIADLIKCGAG